MRALLSRVVIGALGVLTIGNVEAFDYHAYRPYKLGQVIREQATTEMGDWNIVGANSSYRVTVTYSGKIRKIVPETRSLIGFWAKSVGLGRNTSQLFAHEIKVTEDGAEYWLPIQEVLVKPLQSEVQPGKQVDLFVAWIGSTKRHFIFIVNEFQAGDDAPAGGLSYNRLEPAAQGRPAPVVLARTP